MRLCGGSEPGDARTRLASPSRELAAEMSPAARRLLLAGAVIGLAAIVLFGASGLGRGQLGTSPTPGAYTTDTATTTQSPTRTSTPTLTGSAVRPVGYALPSECAYVGEAERRDETTFWLVKCPVGLLSRALAPSLAAQGWESCDTAAGTTYYRKGDQLLLITNFVNRSDATGELGEKTRTGACGP